MVQLSDQPQVDGRMMSAEVEGNMRGKDVEWG